VPAALATARRRAPPRTPGGRRSAARVSSACRLVLLSAVGLALAAAAGRSLAWSQPATARPLVAARGVRRGGRGKLLAAAATRAATSTRQPRAQAPRGGGGTLVPTEEAPFLNVAEQPVLLSPDGARSARFELGDDGMNLRVEAAPAFGPQGTTTSVATSRDVIERAVIIPREKLGIMGVRDLFWLDDRCFLITGYDGFNGRFYGWTVDLKAEKALSIPMPTRESSLFVPTGQDGLPLVRRDEKGGPEILLGFTEVAEGVHARSWTWYSLAAGDLVDAAVSEELPTKLWREAVVSQLGQIEALLLVNGSVYRRSPDGWLGLGTLALAAADGEASMASVDTQLPRQHLVSAGPDYSVFAIDTIGPGSVASPQTTPPLEDLVVPADQEGSLPSSEAEVAKWVLEQCRERQTAALVHMTAVEDAAPLPLFAHPFADVSVSGVWVDPQTDCPEAVAVEDLRPHAYALRPTSRPTLRELLVESPSTSGEPAAGQLLADLRRLLPAKVWLGKVGVPTEEMEPLVASRHGDRWVVIYKHPAMAEPLFLPVMVEDGSVQWIGDQALPVRGGALNALAVAVQPRVEGHRLRAGAHDVPVYLALPQEDPAALVLRVHEGPMQRVGWGADGLDAWLLSRGYGVLKVNYRGSSGFGRRWSSVVPSEDTEGGFLDDLVAAVRWALEERRALPGISHGTDGKPPPVAVMGSYFGGYAALQAMLEHHGSLFACGIAVAPTQALPQWPDAYMPNAEAREVVEALRQKESWPAEDGLSGADPAAAALAPAARAAELRRLPLLVVEFERDGEDAKGDLLQRLAPASSAPDGWPRDLSFVQYAAETRGGGLVRQNGLDQYRRIDNFLHRHLAPLAAGDRPPQREPFVDELPFLSAALLPATKGDLSSDTLSIERGIEEHFHRLEPQKAASFPVLRKAPGKASAAGFGGGGAAVSKAGKRQALVAPKSRLAVREDGTIEVHVALGEEPEGLHCLLSEVWLHIRAKGLGFTIHLPRQPLEGEKVGITRLPGAGNFVFEIAADPSVGAVENYNAWAGAGGRATIMSTLRPEDIDSAPMVVPADVLDM